MKSNIVRMTLTNESITFTAGNIWIQPLNSDRFRFAGSVSDLISILIYHQDIDITNVIFYVRDGI